MNGEREDWTNIGSRLREARAAAGLSVRELARRINVSPSHVSQVERGISSYSVSMLYAVAKTVGVSIDSFFEEPSRRDERAAQASSALDGSVVLRARDRATIKLQSGPRWERLTPAAQTEAEFLEVIYEPHAGDAEELEFARHEGVEYGVVISGELTIQVSFERTVLFPGDSIRLDSGIPHRFWNAGPAEVRAIWFVSRSQGATPSRAEWGGVAPEH